MPRKTSIGSFPGMTVLLCCTLSFTAVLSGCSQSYDDGSSRTGANGTANGAGLDDSAADSANGPSDAADQTAAHPDSAANDADHRELEITLKTVDKAGFDEVISGYKGNVVFVDFWGTWCVSCLKRFPHTVDLHKKYHTHGLRVVSVAIELFVNEPQEKEDDALKELKKQEAAFENLLSDEPLDEAVNTYDISGGGLPELWLFGRDGKLIRKFTNEDPDYRIDDAEVEQAVRAALGLDKTAEGSD